MTQHDKVLIHEYFQAAGGGNYDYLAPGDTPAEGWAATGQAFLLFQDTAADRVPVYRTMYQGTYFVLTAAQPPTGVPGVTTRPGAPEPIGYVTRTQGGNVKHLYQHWDNAALPHAYRFDTNPTLPGYAANDFINFESVYVPKILDYTIALSDGEVVIEDESGGVVTDICVDPGNGNAIRFRSGQAGLSFATLSIYCLDARGALAVYDGRFYIHKWSPSEVVYIDDNRQTDEDKTYFFNVSMHDGETFYNHDPKFINRGSTGVH